MAWIQLHLTVDEGRAARAEQLLESLGAMSVTLDDAADQALLEPAPGETPLWRNTRVTGLFPEEIDRDRLQGEILRLIESDISQTLVWEPLRERVWERVWLEDFRPMRFGQHLWVCPDGQRPAQGTGIFIDLDPGVAFGTGTHPTTALCLNWLDGARLKGSRVIDFGCGSGILSVAALKLGAQEVIAIDHDPQALEATRANGEKNGVAERLRIWHSESLPALDKADLVLANILAGTLIELAPSLAELLLPGGRIVLSGLLLAQSESVSVAYANDFDRLQQTTLENWVLLEGRRR